MGPPTPRRTNSVAVNFGLGPKADGGGLKADGGACLSVDERWLPLVVVRLVRLTLRIIPSLSTI